MSREARRAASISAAVIRHSGMNMWLTRAISPGVHPLPVPSPKIRLMNSSAAAKEISPNWRSE